MLAGLMRKDFQLLRKYFVIPMLGMIGGYVAFFVIFHLFPMGGRAENLAFSLMVSSNGGFTITCLSMAIICGSAFTIERSDRSVEFLACLPPSRFQHLQSKLFVVGAMLSSMIAINGLAAILYFQILPYAEPGGFKRGNEPEVYAIYISIISCIGGVSWGAAAISNSNGIPALAGLISPLSGYLVLFILHLSFEPSLAREIGLSSLIGTFLTLGFTGFICGCYWYLLRREP